MFGKIIGKTTDFFTRIFVTDVNTLWQEYQSSWWKNEFFVVQNVW